MTAVDGGGGGGGSDYELLTEHLGYPPVALLDDIINTVNVLAERALDSVERLLLSIPPAKLGFASSPRSNAVASERQDATTAAAEAAKAEIENGTHQLETLLNTAIDKNFDLFELYTMRNIFSVRPEDQPYVRLAHYDGLDFSTPADTADTAGATSVSLTDEKQASTANSQAPLSVTALRRQLHASQKLQVALEAETARNDALLRNLRGLLGVPSGTSKEEKIESDDKDSNNPAPFAFLRHKSGLEEGGTEHPLTTTTEFALSQLESLRALSTTLRTLLPKLGTEQVSAFDDDEDSDGSTQDAAHKKLARKGSKGAETTSDEQKSWRRQRTEYVETSTRKYLQRTGRLELDPQGAVRDGEWQGRGPDLAREDVVALEEMAAMLARDKDSRRREGEAHEAKDER